MWRRWKDILNALVNYELEEIQDMETSEEAKQKFKITDTNSLIWTLRKLKALNQQVDDVNITVNNEIERIKTWQLNETNGVTNSRNFFESLISEYAYGLLAVDKEFKSVKTPHGSIGFKKQQKEYSYDDNDKLIEYLENNNLSSLVRVKKEPEKNDIKKTFALSEDETQLFNTTTGEVVPGIKVVKRPDKVDIKLL